ncbi:MAG: adenylyl-sulfate kinase [Candidatus Omnitrophica bacterium]|nr:adenylyl-sulfate kinase [Candidatus Omnitrophota bacterium]
MTETAVRKSEERMNLVIVGHVDHGKSTVIGRLLADTGSLPEGKLEQVKAMCERNSRPFEYAFLLDALKNEQSQGITIDTARCFFKTDKRHYIINDAPGHIEFLKNMITGAARAEAALLVIDAEEGIQENSKRHGYMISMLGIKQIAVLVNKMDLVDYSQEVFERIVREYNDFLGHLGVHPMTFIPVAAREGDNIATISPHMPWYEGHTVLDQVDAFTRPEGSLAKPFRLPVQDIYKFTAQGDDRRIISGTVETGTAKVGDHVIFYPSGKETIIESVERFNAPNSTEVKADEAVGVTMTTEIYIKPGELMCRADELKPKVGRRFRANVFWMGRAPMIPGKQYKLKIGATKVATELASIESVLDASELETNHNKQQLDRHDVGEIILETHRPVAFDNRNDIEPTGRFVIVDDFEIAGAGVILEKVAETDSIFDRQIKQREFAWEAGEVSAAEREQRFNHKGKFIIVTGEPGSGRRNLAKKVEKHLFDQGFNTYYFGITNQFGDLDQHGAAGTIQRDRQIEILGELARIMTDAGLLFITILTDIDEFDLNKLRKLNEPNEVFVVSLGDPALGGAVIDVQLEPSPEIESAVEKVVEGLTSQQVFMDFSI